MAVLVPSDSGRSNLCVAVQAPVIRLPREKAESVLPALRRAAQALASWATASPTRLAQAVCACISAAAAAPLTPLGLTPAVSEQPNETTLLKTLKAALGKRDAPV